MAWESGQFESPEKIEKFHRFIDRLEVGGNEDAPRVQREGQGGMFGFPARPTLEEVRAWQLLDIARRLKEGT